MENILLLKFDDIVNIIHGKSLSIYQLALFLFCKNWMLLIVNKYITNILDNA